MAEYFDDRLLVGYKIVAVKATQRDSDDESWVELLLETDDGRPPLSVDVTDGHFGLKPGVLLIESLDSGREVVPYPECLEFIRHNREQNVPDVRAPSAWTQPEPIPCASETSVAGDDVYPEVNIEDLAESLRRSILPMGDRPDQVLMNDVSEWLGTPK